MSPTAVESYLEMLCAEIPALRRQLGVENDTCIETSRIAVELLRARGWRARPMPCQLLVYSAELWKRLALNRDPADPDEDPDEWAQAGAMMAVVGFTAQNDLPVEEGKFDGHVVVIVQERYLLDLTVTQVRREHLPVEDFWGPCSRKFAKGEASLIAQTDVGPVLTYHPRPDLLPEVVRSKAWRTLVRVRQTREGDRLWVA